MFIDSSIVITAILTLALSLVIMDARIFLIEVGIFIILFFTARLDGSAMYNFFSVLQVMLGCYSLCRTKKAVDFNYYLILEKTHQIPQNITKYGPQGDFSLFKKPY